MTILYRYESCNLVWLKTAHNGLKEAYDSFLLLGGSMANMASYPYEVV